MEKISRKQRENERRKYEIIQAALSAFASKGFHGATMAEISTVSEFPLATIYKLFCSKERVYFELIRQKARELTSLIHQAISDKSLSPVERLRKGIYTHYFFCLDNKDFTKIYLEERQRLGSILSREMKYEVRDLLEKLLNIFGEVFQEGIDKDQFKPYSSRELAELFIGLVSSAASNWLIYCENDHLLGQRLDTGFSIFIGGISKQ